MFQHLQRQRQRLFNRHGEPFLPGGRVRFFSQRIADSGDQPLVVRQLNRFYRLYKPFARLIMGANPEGRLLLGVTGVVEPFRNLVAGKT